MRAPVRPQILATLFLAVLAAVASTAAAGPTWTPDDVLHAESASSWTVSPDGSTAVWVKSTVTTVDGAAKRVSNLWLTRLADDTSIPLTRGEDIVASPLFSPDGVHVAFLSTAALPGGGTDLGHRQVWVIALAGGAPYPVTRFDRSVADFGWIGDGTLLAAAQESPSWWEQERKDEKDTSIVVDDAAHEPPVRLFTVPLAGGAAHRLTDNTDWIDLVSVAPDGRHAVVRAQESLSYEYDQKVPPRTFLVDLPSGRMTRLFADGRLRPGIVQWAPDAASFYFTNEYSSDPVYRTATVTQLWVYDLAGGRAEQVDLHTDRGLGGDFRPMPDGVVALLADGVRYRPARLVRTASAWAREDLTGAHAANLDAVQVSRDGATLLYQFSSATTPPQWFAARLDGAALTGARKLTDLNPGWADKPTGKVEVVHFKGALGDEVEGLLHYPLGWRPGTRCPLVLQIHGGPTGVDRDSWSSRWASPVILWRQRGAFVLQVNYHGSVGYGLKWVESIGRGKYYDLEVPDLEAGVDEMIRRGLVDPDRLASAGWSNGGILTAALITRDTRFKAASVGAADVEWFSDWANVDFGASFDNYYFGGAPWEVPQVYMEKSPFFRLTKVRTPTIVYTGTQDRNVPPHESWSLFRALQQIGKVPVRLVLFPGEPHGLRTIAHQRRKLTEDLEWFDRYLFGREDVRDESVKKGSLLAGLLLRSGARRAGNAWGEETGGILVPETVPFGGLDVGRFEVTRAQFAAFDPSAKAGSGEENLPATGVPFQRAEAYAAWLSKRTGRAYRLPTEAEAAALAKEAGHAGNTLDRWAGYTPNPDDAARLAGALAKLGGTPLLLPAGSLSGAGDAGVFDLDGNAAEWAVAADGSGVAVGPSADRSTDPRATAAPSPAYTGFRVVLDGNGA